MEKRGTSVWVLGIRRPFSATPSCLTTQLPLALSKTLIFLLDRRRMKGQAIGLADSLVRGVRQ